MSSEPGRAVIGFSPFSTFFCSASGQPPGGWPRSPRSIDTTESGKAMSLRRVLDIGDGQVLAHHHQRHVADDLGRRRHLDDVAEHLVDVGIGLRHLVPARLQPERARLLLEVGELAARHLVQIDFRGRRLEVALEGRVLVAHRLPVERDLADRLPDRARGRARCRCSASTSEPRQGCEVLPESASIAASTASTPASTAASTVAADSARRVVGVEMDRQADLLAAAP